MMTALREMFRHTAQYIGDNNFEQAFQYVLESNTNYSICELSRFFVEERICNNSFGISGSGGSGIAKPNIGTLLAYHLSRILFELDTSHTVIKFGSRAKTSISGSIDFGSKITHKNFALINEEMFNATVSMLRLNPSIDEFVKQHYISSCHTSKKLVFCLNRAQADSILSRCAQDTEFMFIYSTLFGQDFDELIPRSYYVYKRNQVPLFKGCKKFTEHAFSLKHSEIYKKNIKLLFGNFDSCAWGHALKIAIVEALCFFLGVPDIEGKQIFRNYASSNKTLILFDLDGTLLDSEGFLSVPTKKAVDVLKKYADVGINSGATLSSVVKKISDYKFDFIMANYSSILLSKKDFVEFAFEDCLVEQLMTEICCTRYVLIDKHGETDLRKNIHKIVFYTTNYEQFAKFAKSTSIFIFDGYIEAVPLNAKARGLHYIKKAYHYRNIICVGNDQNDFHMFEESDFFYTVGGYETRLNRHCGTLDDPHSEGWSSLVNDIKYILDEQKFETNQEA